jgi:protein-L-isoaspartate(D-aspartate) O-methyltransferase
MKPPFWPPHWPAIHDRKTLAAIKQVPRHLFVPPERRGEAYEDIPLPIGLGQTISQPYIVALMTQALALECTSRVLEVGTGSGYQAAVLAEITPHVWSIEALPELAAAAQARLSGLGYPVQVQVGDGRLGWAEQAPFDAVIVAAAAPDVPPALVEQLAPGGRLVIPVGASVWDQCLWRIGKDQAGRLAAEWLADVRFVPLVALGETAPEDDARRQLRRELARLTRGDHDTP